MDHHRALVATEAEALMGCELCDAKGPTRTIEIEGEVLEVCRRCRQEAGR